jgi:hypothetical protein
VRGFLDGSHPDRVDADGLVVAVTSGVRAGMLDNPEDRRRVATAVEAVTGHRLTVGFAATAVAPEPTRAPAEREAPPDGDALLAEFKMMFNATEEGDDR